MIKIASRIAAYCAIFALLQVAVGNHVHLFGVATPFIYIYVILKMPVDMSQSAVTAVSFLLGLTIDVFSNTPGMHAAACSFAGFARTPLLNWTVIVKELPSGSIPSYKLFGFGKFLRYAVVMAGLHHIVLFLIDSFTFFQPGEMFARMAASVLFTSLMLCVFEAFNIDRSKNG